MTRIAVLILVACTATGCLRKDTTHTLYLSPDGSVKWVVEESHVYSDHDDEGERAAEEQAYIGSALIGSHRAAAALQAIKPDGLVHTTVIRDERPFHVVTDTQFLRVDRMLGRLFDETGLRTSVTLEEKAGHSILRMRFDFTRTIEERNSPAAALLEDFENFRFALSHGRFVAGGGFDVPDRRQAVLSREWMEAVERAVSERRGIELVLTWTLASMEAGQLPTARTQRSEE